MVLCPLIQSSESATNGEAAVKCDSLYRFLVPIFDENPRKFISTLGTRFFTMCWSRTNCAKFVWSKFSDFLPHCTSSKITTHYVLCEKCINSGTGNGDSHPHASIFFFFFCCNSIRDIDYCNGISAVNKLGTHQKKGSCSVVSVVSESLARKRTLHVRASRNDTTVVLHLFRYV